MGWNDSPDYGGPPVRWWDFIIWPALIVLIGLGAVQCMRIAKAQPAEIAGVASVIDGDTIEIHGQRIRLHGIDAPERGRHCGRVNAYQRASLALADIVGRQTVSCAVNGEDRYHRSVAVCTAGGHDIAEAIVEQGWARDWPRYSHHAYAEQERDARAAQRGLWAMECPGLWGDRNYD